MKKRNYNIEKDFLMKQRDLLLEIQKVKDSYTEEEIDYLTSIIMLERSVLKANNYSEIFHDSDLMFEIAKFNICKRAIHTIQKLDIDQRKVFMSSGYGGLSILYNESGNNFFNIFYADLATRDPWNGNKVRPYINVNEIVTPIKDEKQDVEMNENVQAQISNLVTRALFNDWNVDSDIESLEKGQRKLVKSLSFIDIYKKSK